MLIAPRRKDDNRGRNPNKPNPLPGALPFGRLSEMRMSKTEGKPFLSWRHCNRHVTVLKSAFPKASHTSRSTFAVCLSEQTIAADASNELEQLQTQTQRSVCFGGEPRSLTLLFSGNSVATSDFALYLPQWFKSWS